MRLQWRVLIVYNAILWTLIKVRDWRLKVCRENYIGYFISGFITLKSIFIIILSHTPFYDT